MIERTEFFKQNKQEEIIKRWKNIDDRSLSVICIAYNQEKYIDETMQGFLSQITDFKFEILLHDDASTDSTADIIREYEKNYPDIVKPIYQTENQFSKGIAIGNIYLYPRVNSKYLALCEGDDYWTDPYKLQKQVDFLEAHPEYSGCFHPVKVIRENGEHKDSIYPSKKKMRWKKFVTKDDLLKTNYIQTNSVVYRWAFLDKDIKDYFPDNVLPGDLYLHLLHAQYGNIAFLPDVMAVYRKQPGGIWFNPDERILKYGLRIIKFHYSVWKNFTNSSEEYLVKTVLPTIKIVSDTYYKNGKFDELEFLKETYNELYTRAIYVEETDKQKKYKKLFNISLVLNVILFTILLIELFLKFSKM